MFAILGESTKLQMSPRALKFSQLILALDNLLAILECLAFVSATVHCKPNFTESSGRIFI